jgi:hypothetical protein
VASRTAHCLNSVAERMYSNGLTFTPNIIRVSHIVQNMSVAKSRFASGSLMCMKFSERSQCKLELRNELITQEAIFGNYIFSVPDVCGRNLKYSGKSY